MAKSEKRLKQMAAKRAAREARANNPGGMSRYAKRGEPQSRPNREERARGVTRRWPVFCAGCYCRHCVCHERQLTRAERDHAQERWEERQVFDAEAAT